MGTDNRLSRAAQTAIVALLATATTTVQAAAQSDNHWQAQMVFLFGVWAIAMSFLVIIWFAPAIIAFRRDHPNKWAIAVVCLAFGATIIGWFGALIWALHAVHRSPDGGTGGESGLNIFGNDPVRVKIEPDIRHDTEALADRLSRLKKLLDDGLISDDEHQALRKAALGEL